MTDYHNAYVVELVVPNRSDPPGTADDAKRAVTRMLEKARRFPPDGRFDWTGAYVAEVERLKVVRSP